MTELNQPVFVYTHRKPPRSTKALTRRGKTQPGVTRPGWSQWWLGWRTGHPFCWLAPHTRLWSWRKPGLKMLQRLLCRITGKASLYPLLPISIVNSPANSISKAARWWTQAEAIGWWPLQPSIAVNIYVKAMRKRSEPCQALFLCSCSLLLPRTWKKHVTLNWKPWKSASLPANEQLAIETSSLAFISAGCWSIHEPLTWPL